VGVTRCGEQVASYHACPLHGGLCVGWVGVWGGGGKMYECNAPLVAHSPSPAPAAAAVARVATRWLPPPIMSVAAGSHHWPCTRARNGGGRQAARGLVAEHGEWVGRGSGACVRVRGGMGQQATGTVAARWQLVSMPTVHCVGDLPAKNAFRPPPPHPAPVPLHLFILEQHLAPGDAPDGHRPHPA
jgi:hypothetical protein